MRENVRVTTGDGTELGGWWYPPSSGSTDASPAIVLSHGFSAIRAMGLDGFAQVFASAGFGCLVYDHRNYGDSSGSPRHESDPWQQVHDMRDAITWLRQRDDVDGERIGLWGTSYAGGHVLTVGALDKRVKAVVSQVPLVRGYETFLAWVPEDRRERFIERLIADREARAAGADPQTVRAAVPGSETEEWVHATDDGTYANEVTIRSFEMLWEYEPEIFIDRISPTPLLMVIAAHDTQTPTPWQREAFEKAREPKRLVELDCRHYDPYVSHLAAAADAAREWFVEHLGQRASG